MGLKLREDENLYMFRMSITLDEQTSTASFMDPDHKRLEQLIIDALGTDIVAPDYTFSLQAWVRCSTLSE